jgi:N-terminal acetyltransferase B complex catalytic subunit
MVSIRRFDLSDLWHVNRINIDQWTETFSFSFYVHYALQWPELNWTLRDNSGGLVGYIIGSTKVKRDQWLSHVIAVTISSDVRRLGYGTELMKMLERTCDVLFNSACVGLYVRESNSVARALYERMGYKIHRKLLNYYDHVHEHGLDLRKSLSSDPGKIFERELSEPVLSNDMSDSD